MFFIKKVKIIDKKLGCCWEKYYLYVINNQEDVN
jgi:hypothetical protein